MKCVHLDFHTSPDISDIGSRFNKEEFTATVKAAKIDLMTVFAKCHHGYTYYPSKVSTMHPGLKFNLLKEEIEAIHAAGAKAPIYITMGWSKKDADEHPEWHHKDFITKKPIYMNSLPSDNPDEPIGDCSWTTLCPLGGYADHLEAITHEICESFDVSDGVFYDICFINNACGCDACLEGMKKRGLDPTSLEDARLYYKEGRIAMMKKLTGIVKSYAPDATVFYNGGANMNRTEYHPHQTHFELEDLPTAWGGYDLMPLRAKFFERYGKPFLGMTGKFHHAWGEFGGFKNKEALRYECADMMSVGASISVGDHLHPLGALDESTYRLLTHSFNYVDSIEKYCLGTKAYTDVAIWLSHNSDSDMGASKLLQIMHLDFDVIESASEINGHKLIIIPDRVKLTEEDEIALESFTRGGGKVVMSYESASERLGVKKLSPSEYSLDYIQCPIGDYTTPFLAYSSAYKVECDGETLASVYEPYFNRTHGHFCGHKNTPNKPSPADYPALVKRENVLYFAHPVFEAYDRSGNYVLEEYIKHGILKIYDPYVKTTSLPSSARVRTRVGRDFIGIHLLYAPPVNRGNVCLLPDFPVLHDVKLEIKTDRKITSATAIPEGTPVAFEYTDGGVILSPEPFSLHKLIVLK